MACSSLLSFPWAVARSVLGKAWGPNGPPWALMGRALLGPPLGFHGSGPRGPGHLWAGPFRLPMSPHGLGPCGPPMGP